MNLVADIGGTNTRLALCDGSRLVPDTIRSSRNDDTGSFEVALGAYLGEIRAADLSAVCIAVAGPVAGDRARLTNRDWHFEARAVARAAGAERAVLLNDLAALGYALPHLREDQVRTLRPAASGTRAGNGQRFVLGLGTGVNLAVSRETATGAHTVLEAEAGHVALPAPVARALEVEAGVAAQGFETVEALFAGKGLSALHAALTGTPRQPAHRVIDMPGAQATTDLMARLLGLTLRELILAYMPLSGVYLAGGAARGLMGRSRAAMLDTLSLSHDLGEILATPPVHLITDDAAALAGCAARLLQDG